MQEKRRKFHEIVSRSDWSTRDGSARTSRRVKDGNDTNSVNQAHNSQFFLNPLSTSFLAYSCQLPEHQAPNIPTVAMCSLLRCPYQYSSTLRCVQARLLHVYHYQRLAGLSQNVASTIPCNTRNNRLTGPGKYTHLWTISVRAHQSDRVRCEHNI